MTQNRKISAAPTYQERDRHLIDYHLYHLPGLGDLEIRGPLLTGTDYAAFIGASQTFGRFVATPFPELVSRALGTEALNLGRGGAGPDYFLNSPALLDYVNRARIVIVQILSARSQSNARFDMHRNALYGIDRMDGAELRVEEFYSRLVAQDPEAARRIVADTREKYLAAMKQLLDAIKPPKVLLWLSVRTPEYQEEVALPLHRLWGAFPQFVNRAMVEALRGACDAYVECVSRRGLPQPIVDRKGKPSSFSGYSAELSKEALKTVNNYYPSPEMHEDAAALLIPVCRDVLDAG